MVKSRCVPGNGPWMTDFGNVRKIFLGIGIFSFWATGICVEVE